MTETEQFIARCREETETVSRLLVLLEKEQRALVTGDILQLEPISDEKVRVLKDLSDKGRARQTMTDSLGLASLDGVRKWLSDKPEACAVWLALEDAMRKAQVLNQFNGQRIDEGLDNTRRALKALKAAASSVMGYGRDGSQGALPVGGRHLGSA